MIESCVARLRRMDPGRTCEIVVVDGDPGASTLRAITDPDVVTLTSPRGRAVQMNAGAAAARGDILLFLHVDTALPPGAPALIGEVAGDPRYTGGAFRLRFDSDRPVYKAMAAMVSIRTRLNRMPYGDQAIFLRRTAFDALGGFAAIPVMEDVDLVRRIRRRGWRLRMLDAAVVTSRRRMEAEGLLRAVTRNIALVALYRLGVSPARLAAWYTDDYRLASHGDPPVRRTNAKALRAGRDRS